MRNALRNFLDLSYTPTWREILMDVIGAAACFLMPVALLAVIVAFGWVRV